MTWFASNWFSGSWFAGGWLSGGSQVSIGAVAVSDAARYAVAVSDAGDTNT